MLVSCFFSMTNLFYRVNFQWSLNKIFGVSLLSANCEVVSREAYLGVRISYFVLSRDTDDGIRTTVFFGFCPCVASLGIFLFIQHTLDGSSIAPKQSASIQLMGNFTHALFPEHLR